REESAVVADRLGSGVGARRGHPIACFNREAEARIAQRSRVQMFETAAAFRSQVQNKGVVLVRNFAAHDFDFSSYYLLHILAHLLCVVITFSVDDDAMRHTLD